MTTTLETELRKQLAALDEQIERLNASKAAIVTLLVGDTAAPTPAKPQRLKAPNGTLPAAILALKPHKLTNKEIRDALAASGYKYSLKAELVRQVLFRMRVAKKLKATGEGLNTRYSVA